eukprot:TCONS_00009406-protein
MKFLALFLLTACILKFGYSDILAEEFEDEDTGSGDGGLSCEGERYVCLRKAGYDWFARRQCESSYGKCVAERYVKEVQRYRYCVNVCQRQYNACKYNILKCNYHFYICKFRC